MNRFFGSSMTSRILGVVGALWLLCVTLMPGAQAAPQAARPQVAPSQEALPQTIAFNRDIRPILSDKCFKCHGPGTQFATLRFDLEDGAKHDLSGGRHAIVPGDPASSQMIARVTATNPQIRMPRSQGGAEAGDPLSPREIALLRRWIEQ